MPTITEKEVKLRKYKSIATGLFVLMAVIFLCTFFLYKDAVATGYIRAFAEAAMVGALADWFAVTALFRHPLGLPIPHTNLIEANKESIGENLGGFIAENFLTSANIRPRIKKLQVAQKIGEWISLPQNRELLIREIIRMSQEAIQQINDTEIERIIVQKGKEWINLLNGGALSARLLNGILDRGLHEGWITILAQNIEKYIASNPELIAEKVRSESHILIPDFVDDYLAKKISKGVQNFLEELIRNPQHPQRKIITQRLRQLASDMESLPEWKERMEGLKKSLLPNEKWSIYSQQIWQYLKGYLIETLGNPQSKIYQYLNNGLLNLGKNYLQDPQKASAIDRFIQFQGFKLILRHRKDVADLISNTVRGWESKSLSQKLELEVGKDLQFIRFNGTIVGGVVGLVIYFLSQFLH